MGPKHPLGTNTGVRTSCFIYSTKKKEEPIFSPLQIIILQFQSHQTQPPTERSFPTGRPSTLLGGQGATEYWGPKLLGD